MNFQAFCGPIQASLAEQLASMKTREDKAFVLEQTLREQCKAALEVLNSAAGNKNITAASYRESQATVSDFLTFVILPYTNYCSNFKEGIAVLEGLSEITSDEVIRKKLLIYTSQLKRRWLQADPSALPINPRGSKRVSRTKDHGSLYFALLFVVLGWLAFNVDLHFWAQKPLEQAPPNAAEAPKPHIEVADAPQAEPVAPSAPTAAPPSPEYFSYKDSKGVIHLGNRPIGNTPSLPLQHSDRYTHVSLHGNQVLVPTVLSYRGRTVKTTLLLDTGATITTINEEIAGMLGIGGNDRQQATSTVADGRKVPSGIVVADLLEVGGKRLGPTRIAIMSGAGGQGHDGLLGMDFLRNFRYHVNFTRSVIEWSE